MRRNVEIVFYKSPLGAPASILWGAELECYSTVRNKNSQNETNEKGSGDVI